MKKISILLAVLFVLSAALPVFAADAIGTEANPIKVLFVPSVDAGIIVSGGEVMAKALHDATGLYFDVSVPASFAATVEEMCASPENTMGFIPPMPYVLGNQECGITVEAAAVRYGYSVYWTEFLVRRDSDIKELKDLNGKSWAYPDAISTSGYFVPSVMFDQMGIKPSEETQAGGHPQAVKAVYNGEADFATAFYSAYIAPDGVAAWKEGDNPDVPDDVLDSCAVTADGKDLDCGGYIVKDARANIREEAPDVVQKVRILSLSTPIPNDTLAFSPKFPEDTKKKIMDALYAFAKTPEWKTTIGSPDFYDWSDIAPAEDSAYDVIRALATAQGKTLADLDKKK